MDKITTEILKYRGEVGKRNLVNLINREWKDEKEGFYQYISQETKRTARTTEE